MNTSGDQTTANLERTRLRLSDDLIFSPQIHRGEVYYQIESSNARFYRLGYPGYVFVSLLDGRTTFSEALAISAQQLGAKALSSREATTIYLWLLENGLGTVDDQPGSSSNEPRLPSKKKSLPNPFWIRVPLGSPDWVVRKLLPILGFLFTPAATFVAVLVIAGALISVITNWREFTSASSIVFSPSNWLWMTMAWLFLKIIHELAHAICCRRYGGEVKQTGIVFVLLAPLAYVDASSSWRFPSKWSRIHVALAGIYAELLVASVAVFAWQHVETKFAAHMLYNVIFMATASTLLFNANPLMRFDGYFVLSDLLEIPNLYTEAGKIVRGQCERVFFGVRGQLSEHSRRALLLACYGWAAAFWRILVFASLSLAASVLFHGAGLALAAIAICLWGWRWLRQITGQLSARWSVSRLQVVRAVALASSFVMLAIVVLFCVPSPVTVSAPGVIDFVKEEHLRSLTGGFVESVEVHNGQQVLAGQVLVKLRNHDVSRVYQDLQLNIEQTRIEYQTALEAHDTPSAIVANRKIRALEEQLAEATVRFESLTIRSPIKGTVTRRSLEQMLGTFVAEGETLLMVVGEDQKELRLSLGQRDFDAAVPRLGGPVVIRVGSLGKLSGTLKRLQPRASTELSHIALAATHGGPLQVVEANSDDQRSAGPELAEPRFQAVVEFDDDEAQIFSGQVAVAYVGHRRESIGVSIYQAISDWIRRKLSESSMSAVV